MGGKISHKLKNKLEIDSVLCNVCNKNKATYVYSKCGHLGLCKLCANIILENTTSLIKCPKCNKTNFYKKEYI